MFGIALIYRYAYVAYTFLTSPGTKCQVSAWQSLANTVVPDKLVLETMHPFPRRQHEVRKSWLLEKSKKNVRAQSALGGGCK